MDFWAGGLLAVQRGHLAGLGLRINIYRSSFPTLSLSFRFKLCITLIANWGVLPKSFFGFFLQRLLEALFLTLAALLGDVGGCFLKTRVCGLDHITNILSLIHI